MIIGTLLLWVSAAFFVFTSLYSGFAPAGFAAQLGLSLANPGGITEIRAQYAGFFMASAIVCGAALAGVLPRGTAAVALAMIFGGLIAGRLAGIVLNGGITGFPPTVIALVFVDALGFAGALWMILSERAW